MLVTLLWRVSCIDLPETCKHCDSVVYEHPDRLNRRKNQAVYGIISFGASWVVEKKHFRKEDLSIGISSESLCCTSEECYIRCCNAILCSTTTTSCPTFVHQNLVFLLEPINCFIFEISSMHAVLIWSQDFLIIMMPDSIIRSSKPKPIHL